MVRIKAGWTTDEGRGMLDQLESELGLNPQHVEGVWRTYMLSQFDDAEEAITWLNRQVDERGFDRHDRLGFMPAG